MPTNVILMMAGGSKRFFDANFAIPKPFIKVNGVSMCEMAITNTIGSHKSEFNFYIVTQQKYLDEYGKELEDIANRLCYKFEIRTVPKLTDGALRSAMIFRDKLETEKGNWVLQDIDHSNEKNYIYNGVKFFNKYHADYGFFSFICNKPQYSYISVVDGLVTDVKEKMVISNICNTGAYFASNGIELAKYANESLERGERVNGETYVSSLFKFPILDGKKVMVFMCNEFFSTGTPKDLAEFIELKQKYKD